MRIDGREGDVVDVTDEGNSTILYPFTEFVLKIYQRCNLACDYCYMYELEDQTWRGRPVKMSAEIFETFASRVVEHVRKHRLEQVNIVLHGGEPLLRGREFIGWAVELLRKSLPGTEVRVRIQTNGVHLDVLTLMMLQELQISIGISLDGDRDANDRHRLRAKGMSSFDAVVAAIELVRKKGFLPLFQNLYATIDLRNSPIETYEFLIGFEPPQLDFLLPHANWDNPPKSYGSESLSPYGDWLSTVFDLWYSNSSATSVRLFHNIIIGILGGNSETESIGLTPVRSVFIETDGTINQVDALKSAFEGATSTGLDIVRNSFDEVMRHPGIRARQAGLKALSSICQKCGLVDVCGGGYYPHRFRSDTGFINPSIYCPDLTTLIRHIGTRVAPDIEQASFPADLIKLMDIKRK